MPLKILTVDDSNTIRMVVRRSLDAFKVTVLEAANGQEGLAIAATQQPDLIVLDITMPVMDGVTMLTKLQANAELKTIPVIMLTAEGSPENIAFVTKLGARDFLVKPFKESQLVEKISRVLTLERKAA